SYEVLENLLTDLSLPYIWSPFDWIRLALDGMMFMDAVLVMEKTVYLIDF
ncbi:hypothetical protein RYX36_025438, partial [Vicia faba]